VSLCIYVLAHSAPSALTRKVGIIAINVIGDVDDPGPEPRVGPPPPPLGAERSLSAAGFMDRLGPKAGTSDLAVSF
jgi:hypothetical protein